MRTMKIVQLRSGFTFSFGWDPIKRRSMSDTVFWDNMEGQWDIVGNSLAGNYRFPFMV